MPRQNRATPTGEIIATPERGMFMGNRGRLHNENGEIIRRWTYKNWIICKTEFNGRKRDLMAPNKYTELFFLDEATALAAGHKPCGECRRADFVRFRNAWAKAFTLTDRPRSAAIDNQLHNERVVPIADRPLAKIGELPSGTFVSLPESATAYVCNEGQLYPWSPDGYEDPLLSSSDTARLLTPPSTVEVLCAGYRPVFHSTLTQRSIGR